MRSLMLIARWPRISSSRSSWPGRIALLLRWRRVHDSSDRVHEQRPAIPLAQQLRLPRRRQLVVLRALVGFAEVPLRLEPAALLEAGQRGIQGAGFARE